MVLKPELPEPSSGNADMPVQLARMEGTLNLVAERVQNLAHTVDGHSRDIAELKSLTQSLSESAKAEATKAVALAQALKEADEARRAKTETTWSPFSKALTTILALMAVASVLIQLFR